MENRKILYEKSNDCKDVFADDVMSSAVNGMIRINFMDTSICYPTDATIDNVGNLTLNVPQGNNTLIKKINCNVIVPIGLVPSIIKNLQITYDKTINKNN